MQDEYPKAYFYKRIVQAKLFIDQHYASSIDLDNIANEALFSKYHFIRQFKKVHGQTPKQYLAMVRIEHAKMLLMKGENLSDVCFQVGYDSISSFCALFKKHVGESPTTYKIDQEKLLVKHQEKPLEYVPGCFAYRNGWVKKSNFQE